jgi:hypothetical protein
VSTATCDFRFSLQNRYAEVVVNELVQFGISNRAVTISGRATMSEKEISRTDFIGAKAVEIRTKLRDFLAEHRLPRDNDLVILDMEPDGFSPGSLGKYEGKQQRDLIDAYRRRIRVARQVLRQKAGGVELALYQVIVPDVKGGMNDAFRQRMAGYEEAGRRGMYDQLDYICPVLYQRFGPDDAGAETVRRWTARATRQAIEGSLGLTRRNGKRIPLAPILGFWVFNRNSANNRKAVSPESVAAQLRIVQGYDGVQVILFWSGSETKEEMERQPKPVEPIDIAEFLRSVGTLPWPGCT